MKFIFLLCLSWMAIAHGVFVQASQDHSTGEIKRDSINISAARFQSDNAKPEAKAGIELHASLKEIIDWYSEASSRTVLQHPSLRAASISLQIPGTNRVDIINALEKVLHEQEISCIPDGDKFVMIVPNTFASNAIPHLPKVTPAETGNSSGAKPTTRSEVRVFKAGTIDFPNTDLSQVLEIYAALYSTNRVSFEQNSLDEAQKTGVLRRFITLKTATPLTKEEVCYAIETLIGWNGVKIVPGTNNTLKLVSISAK